MIHYPKQLFEKKSIHQEIMDHLDSSPKAAIQITTHTNSWIYGQKWKDKIRTTSDGQIYIKRGKGSEFWSGKNEQMLVGLRFITVR